MASILTNSSALTALRNLANTQNSLSKTQSQISTGLKVASAGDNTTNWSVSTQMKTDNSVIGTIKDTLKQNSDLLATATSAINGLLDTVEKIKVELAKAKDVKMADGFTSINTSLLKLKDELNGIVDNAALNGVNLLDNTVADMDTVAADSQVTMVSGWSGGTAGSGFKTISVNTTDVKTAITTATATWTVDATNVGTIADNVETFLSDLRDYAVELGSAKNQIDAQSKFLSTLSESITNSVSTLVDADMNEASTRLQALQTQQQLGVQSLSIANQNSQMILKLFG
jgi:flagellin